VTLMLAFGEGLHRQVQVAQKGLGDAIVIAWPSRTSKPWQGLPRGRRIQMTDEDVELLRREVEEIGRISEEYSVDGARMTWGRSRCRSTSRARTSSSTSCAA
jgi:putative ABC transport system permease protein